MTNDTAARPAPSRMAPASAARDERATPARLLATTVLLALWGAACSHPAQPAPADGAGQIITIELQAATPATLPRCDDALAGTTAYVASPVSLYTCQAGAWLPVPCTKLLAGAVAFATASQTLLACTKGAWTPVALPPGPVGPTGPQGATGARGAPGTLLAVSVEAAGTNCPAGGQRIDVGADMNGNGTLDGGEITRTAFVCDGAMGAMGAPGAAGPKGDTGERGPSGLTTLAAATAEPAGANCAQGGVKVSTGVDVNANGVLDGTEGANATYVCNGARGSDGAPGAPGQDGEDGATSLVNASPEPAGASCVNGGVRIDTGLDADGDGGLAPGEVTRTAYVCNGGSSTRVARFDDPTCDPAVAPDADRAVFADVMNGDDVLGTGDVGTPVQSVGRAIALAAARGRSSVYLAPGVYGVATLPAGSAIYIEGGWLHGALGSWTRNCEATAREGTVLAGVVVNGGGGLRALTVRAENSPSNLAVRVAAGTLRIRDCALLAGDAAHGAVGQDGAMGAAGLGVGTACSNGAPGLGAAPGVPSTGGSFAASGLYQPGNGGTAAVTSSQDGRNGGAGAPVTCSIGYCQTDTVYRTDAYCGSYNYQYSCNPHSCGCSLFGGCDTCYDTCYQTQYFSCNVPVSCSPIQTATNTVAGPCGQGGKGGGPGLGGTGGGASVALVIASGASVDVIASRLTTRRGGEGAPGGAGGPGGLGGAGQSATCMEGSCGTSVPPCSQASTTKVSPPGVRGGDGARGPTGGSGAGGPSYGIVQLGTGALTIDAASTISVGWGGFGAAGAGNGAQQTIVTF